MYIVKFVEVNCVLVKIGINDVKVIKVDFFVEGLLVGSVFVEKLSGGVIWIFVMFGLELGLFWWFGGELGELFFDFFDFVSFKCIGRNKEGEWFLWVNY